MPWLLVKDCLLLNKCNRFDISLLIKYVKRDITIPTISKLKHLKRFIVLSVIAKSEDGLVFLFLCNTLHEQNPKKKHDLYEI